MDFDLPRDLADWQRRVRAFVACRPCVVGWALYLAFAVLLVVFAGAR